MFTGIIQEVGSIYAVSAQGSSTQLTIQGGKTSRELEVGDSVSINGVCQTVVTNDGEHYTVVAVEETLLKTTLGGMKPSSRVNIELAMQLGDRLGGHLVSGHVDCVGQIRSVEQKGTSCLFKVAIPEQFQRYVIPVGSIAIDGVSLTIARSEGAMVTVSIIPHTFENTIFSTYKEGTTVNLEFDMIGKYVERLVTRKDLRVEGDSVSIEELRSWGYEL